jgi:glucose-1-phosphate thymidylyltransferase
MKGIILAGGTGSRLYPLTKVTNKHLLPVYDRPMIFYPLQTLLDAGINEIMVVSGKGHAGHFLELLGSGSDWGARFTYEIQDEAGGIAQALGLAEDFADDEDVAVTGLDLYNNGIFKLILDKKSELMC